MWLLITTLVCIGLQCPTIWIYRTKFTFPLNCNRNQIYYNKSSYINVHLNMSNTYPYHVLSLIVTIWHFDWYIVKLQNWPHILPCYFMLSNFSSAYELYARADLMWLPVVWCPSVWLWLSWTNLEGKTYWFQKWPKDTLEDWLLPIIEWAPRDLLC